MHQVYITPFVHATGVTKAGVIFRPSSEYKVLGFLQAQFASLRSCRSSFLFPSLSVPKASRLSNLLCGHHDHQQTEHPESMIARLCILSTAIQSSNL